MLGDGRSTGSRGVVVSVSLSGNNGIGYPADDDEPGRTLSRFHGLGGTL